MYYCFSRYSPLSFFFFFFFNDTATTEIYTLSLHDALPIYYCLPSSRMLKSKLNIGSNVSALPCSNSVMPGRSEEHTSELQSRPHLVCRLLLEKKKNTNRLYSRLRSLIQYESQLAAHSSVPT